MGKAPQQNAQLPAMETKLANQAWTMYEHILHLDTSMESLAKEWNNIAQLRVQILQAYGVNVGSFKPPSGVVAPGAATLAAVSPMMGAAAQPGDVQWKSKLQEVVCKKLKRSLTKEEMSYQVTDADGGFVAMLSSGGVLSADYHSDAAQPSKKGAESAAAKVAMQAEFPKEFALLSSGQPLKQTQPQGVKRKADAVEIEPKSRLNMVAMLLLSRAVTKADIIYTTTQNGTQYSATVQIPEYDASKIFQGQAADSKKAAETSAAQMALKGWNSVITPLEAEHKAKKAALNKKKLDELAERKKAEKAAAAAK